MCTNQCTECVQTSVQNVCTECVQTSVQIVYQPVYMLFANLCTVHSLSQALRLNMPQNRLCTKVCTECVQNVYKSVYRLCTNLCTGCVPTCVLYTHALKMPKNKRVHVIFWCVHFVSRFCTKDLYTSCTQLCTGCRLYRPNKKKCYHNMEGKKIEQLHPNNKVSSNFKFQFQCLKL
jgi:hypothetical protein